MDDEFEEMIQNILDENKNNKNPEKLINQLKADGILDKNGNIVKSSIQRIFNSIF